MAVIVESILAWVLGGCELYSRGNKAYFDMFPGINLEEDLEAIILATAGVVSSTFN